MTVSTGIITTFTGSSTSGGFSGDGNAASSATLNGPQGIAVDISGIQSFISSLFSSVLFGFF